MKGALAAILRTLVLPAGATSGRRIVLDGVNGLIEVYDAAGLLRERIGFADAYELSSGDPAEVLLADLQAVVNDLGASNQLQLAIESPGYAGGRIRPIITMDSQSADGTIPSLITLLAAAVDIEAAGDGGPDIWLDGGPAAGGVSLPRGLMASASITSNFAAGTPNETDVTGLSVTWLAAPARAYVIQAHARGIATSVAGRTAAYITTAANAHVAEDDFENSSANVVPAPVSVSTSPLTGLSGAVTYKLRCQSVTGAGNWTLAATPEAYLAVYDVGGV